MNRVFFAMLLLLPLAACENAGPTLTSRETFVCTQCHQLPFPGKHSAAEWPDVIARMVAYMQANNKTLPNATEQAEIVRFYQAKAGR